MHTAPDPNSPPLARSLRALWVCGLYAFGLVLPLVGAASLGWVRCWPLDLVTHFPHLWGLSALLAVPLALLTRQRTLAALFALGCILSILHWKAGLDSSAKEGTDAQEVDLFVFNVQMENERIDDLLEYLLADPPDVIGLSEVNSRWITGLRALNRLYPERHELPAADYSGMALYSRLPLSNLRGLSTGHGHTPIIAAELDDGSPLWLMHPPAPKRRRAIARYLPQLEAADEQLTNPRAIVCGDFNSTPWSPNFPRAKQTTPMGTWPMGVPRLLRLPLDHVLVGEAHRIRAWRHVPELGSDHAGVRVTISLAPADPFLGVLERHGEQER